MWRLRLINFHNWVVYAGWMHYPPSLSLSPYLPILKYVYYISLPQLPHARTHARMHARSNLNSARAVLIEPNCAHI